MLLLKSLKNVVKPQPLPQIPEHPAETVLPREPEHPAPCEQPGHPKEYPIALLIGEARVDKSFDLKKDLEYREKQIQEFQSIFDSKPNRVATLLFVVKFERTDLMKRSILNIYPYFKKFQSQISLVVTHLDLSDDQEQDKIDLLRALRIFKAKSILFVGKETSKEELIAQIRASNCLIPIEEGYQFDLSDTIFQKSIESDGYEWMNIVQQMTVRF
ncbi:unnamed protein product [Paramecium octaurelia]|uniref:Uncharacterized protein n=1 Tax=Paramecium octaurelia TaxID=43137 RepID=A0A8S1VMX0_PAROT|nr:unnamed protein product [Paramecium octaurelia]